MQILGFEDLKIWQKGHSLVLKIYQVTKVFPREERFGLISQIRRSSISVCANIAEGHRKSTKDFIRYLEIARGSLDETRYHLILSRDLSYFSNDQFKSLDELVEEISKMISTLTQRLRFRVKN